MSNRSDGADLADVADTAATHNRWADGCFGPTVKPRLNSHLDLTAMSDVADRSATADKQAMADGTDMSAVTAIGRAPPEREQVATCTYRREQASVLNAGLTKAASESATADMAARSSASDAAARADMAAKSD